MTRRTRQRPRAPTVFVVAMLAAGWLAVSDRAIAQEAGNLELLTAVPESPAFVFLEGAPTKVTRPGAVRDFGAALLGGIDAEGRVKQGVAIETTPWVYIPGLAIPLEEYRSSWLKYVLANSQLSLGTARAAGDSGATDLGFGLRLTLWDAGDPMRDETFADSVAAKLRRCLPDTPDVDPAEVDACVNEKMREAYSQFSGARWNASRAAVGFATGVTFLNSDLGEGEFAGFNAWLVGANPIGRDGQVILQLTYRDRPGLAGQPSFSELTYGGRLLGGTSGLNVFLELVGEARSGDDQIDKNSGRWTAGAEFRVASNLWVSAGLGGLFAIDEKKSFVIANLRYGFNKSARLDGLRNAQ